MAGWLAQLGSAPSCLPRPPTKNKLAIVCHLQSILIIVYIHYNLCSQLSRLTIAFAHYRLRYHLRSLSFPLTIHHIEVSHTKRFVPNRRSVRRNATYTDLKKGNSTNTFQETRPQPNEQNAARRRGSRGRAEQMLDQAAHKQSRAGWVRSGPGSETSVPSP